MTLTTHEWGRMQASASQECRNCHDFGATSGAPTARKTCIDE